jgi:hypothetical protein
LRYLLILVSLSLIVSMVINLVLIKNIKETNEVNSHVAGDLFKEASYKVHYVFESKVKQILKLQNTSGSDVDF